MTDGQWINNDIVRFNVGAKQVMGGYYASAFQPAKPHPPVTPLDQVCQELLPIHEGEQKFVPVPEGSPKWWPLDVPSHALLYPDEVKCLLAVARRLRQASRWEGPLTSCGEPEAG